MEVIEVRQPQKSIPREQLKAASGVRRPVSQQARTNGVCDARLQFFAQGVLSIGPAPCDQQRCFCRLGIAPRYQLENIRGIVLPIAIDRRDPRRRRGPRPAENAGTLPGLADMANDPQLGIFGHKARQDRFGGIVARVIGNDDFELNFLA